MSPENEKPLESGPVAREAMTNLRDGLERAHEIVAEAKFAIRQLAQEPPTPAAEGPVNPPVNSGGWATRATEPVTRIPVSA